MGKVAHLHAQALKNLSHADFRAVRSRSLAKAKDFADRMLPAFDTKTGIPGSLSDIGRTPGTHFGAGLAG